MPIESIRPGIKGRYEMTVDNMEAALKDGLAEAFGVPFLVMMMEKAAVNALAPFLAEGERSVGTYIDLMLTAAAPLERKVWAEARITEVKGKLITLEVLAFDEKGPIGRATHGRALINPEDFKVRMNAK